MSDLAVLKSNKLTHIVERLVHDVVSLYWSRGEGEDGGMSTKGVAAWR
jgi:hypothetical protein